MPLCCSTRQNSVANSRRRLSARQPWPAALAGRQRRLPSHASPALPPPSHPIRPVTPSPPGRPLTAVLHSTSRPLPLISRRTSSTPPNVTMSVHPNQRTESVRRAGRAQSQSRSSRLADALPASATTDYRLQSNGWCHTFDCGPDLNGSVCNVYTHICDFNKYYS